MASWSWWDDKKWVPYSYDFSQKLEEANRKGKTKVKVDTERFVDLKDMLQRRYDDTSKRRNVKREEAQAMSELVLFMVGNIPTGAEKKIDDACGLISAFLTPKVTHVVCNKKEVEKNKVLLTKAKNLKIPIMSDDFIGAVIENGSVDGLKLSKYTINLGANDSESETKAKGKGKEKAASESESGEDAKKPKKDEKDAVVAMDVELDEEEDSKDGVASYSKWTGVLTDNGSKVPFYLTVRWRNNCSGDLLGELNWPTKGNTTTQIIGKITGENFSFKEIGIISETPFPFFATGVKFQGTLYQSTDFSLILDKVTSDKKKKTFEGTLSGNTGVRGMIEGNKLVFEEFNQGKKVEYIGAYEKESSNVSGTIANSDKGTTFEIAL